ncbi:hypothetical protein L7F22_062153 [Adiantum nelumboides]|nr:hypothetical protein [Adiantum nelumboides]
MQRETVDTLTHLQDEKSEFTYHSSVSTWISNADKMNKDFFSCFRERPAGTMVRDLRDSLGQLHTCPDEILEMASVYYETLFASDPLTWDVHDARDEVWSFVRPVVSKDMQIAIMRPFSLQKLIDAVHGLDGTSCPGDDGLTRQFFMQYWDLISQPLQEGLQEIFDTGCMPQSMSSGIISLIPKGGDASTLRIVARISTWISKADRMNKVFFSYFKAPIRDEVWSFVCPVVSGDMQTAIMQPFSLQEVTNAVHGLDGASCLGDDGLTCQFFLQYWDLVSQPLQEGLQEIFDSGIMPQSMSSGIISLIPKGGDASTRQWRPITLMSSVPLLHFLCYKVADDGEGWTGVGSGLDWEDCPGDPYFTGRHLELSAELRRLQEMKFEFSHHALVSYWISTADRMNKDFFAIHRERPAGTTMRAIRDAGGALHTDPDQVLAIATESYEDLFTAESLTDEILDAREQIWSSIVY